MVLKKEENNEMRILIKGAGDLATGIAYELWEAGHEVVMTEIPIPLAVRRMVSFSRAVYEGEAQVEKAKARRRRARRRREKIERMAVEQLLEEQSRKEREWRF